MRGVDLLVEMLIRYEAEVLFGVPGDTNVSFYAALRRNEQRIAHVMARDERHAGSMADAYARVSGKVGLVEVPSGAGPMYALPAVAEANLSAVPLILLTFETAIGRERRGIISELDGASLFKAVTKDSYQIKSAALIPDAIRRAFRVATTGRAGAVYLGIPDDILEAEVDDQQVSLHVELDCARAPARPAAASGSDGAHLVSMLAQAARPIFVAGGGTNRSQAGGSLARLAENLAVPVVASITGQGALPDTHPNYLGVIGDNGFHPVALRALEQADLVVYFGSRLGSVITQGGRSPSDLVGRQIVQVDLDGDIVGDAVPLALGIQADVGAVLEQLLTLTNGTDGFSHGPWLASMQAERDDLRTRTAAAVDNLRTTAPLRPELVMRALEKQLSVATVLVSDPGTSTPYLCRYLTLPQGSQYVLQRAYGGLGYALPAAVGAWKAAPEKRIVAMFGDGSFGMNATELETIARLGAPILLLHFNNASFGLIKGLQKMNSGNAVHGVDFTGLDAHRIAEAFGIRHAWCAGDLETLEQALAEAMRSDGPAFIDIAVKSIAEAAAPLAGLLRKLGTEPTDYMPDQNLTF